MSKNNKKFSKLKFIGLFFLFVPLLVIGTCRMLMVEIWKFFSRTLLRLEPAVWRKLFGRRRHKEVCFEDYSERRLSRQKESNLLMKDKLGLDGERLVFEYIRTLPNTEIVACNVENFFCELDLIYLDLEKNDIVFVEVKTRRRENYLHPTLGAVDAKRRKKIALAARKFVNDRGFIDFRRRYDIAIVIWPENKTPNLSIIKDAFREVDAIREYHALDYGKFRPNERV